MSNIHNKFVIDKDISYSEYLNNHKLSNSTIINDMDYSKYNKLFYLGLKNNYELNEDKKFNNLNISYAGDRKNDKILAEKFCYKKDGKAYKSTFVAPVHMFPEDSKRIKCKDYCIIISPFFNKIEYFNNYIDKISPSYHIEQKRLIKSKIKKINVTNISSANQNLTFKDKILINNNSKLSNSQFSFENRCSNNNNLYSINNKNDLKISYKNNRASCKLKDELNKYCLYKEGITNNSINKENDLFLNITASNLQITDSNNYSIFENKDNYISTDDFDILEVIGKGHFSKVFKVKYKKDNEIYAMKCCKKSKLKEYKQKEHAINERRILGNISHPFIVSLKYAFQTEHKLYLVMEYLSGGELFYHLRKKRYFNEESSIFYIGQIICILDFLHENKIIYRDIKPENFVLDSNGYIKLIDFGLSKENIDKDKKHYTKTFCGTCEYLSPEIIKGDPYNQSVDMWSLGVIFYEMLIGVPPFYDSNKDKLYKKIYFNDPNYALNKKVVLSDTIIDFLSKLLVKNPCQRMTIRDAKKHKLFKGFNFEKLMCYELKAPLTIKNDVRI